MKALGLEKDAGAATGTGSGAIAFATGGGGSGSAAAGGDAAKYMRQTYISGAGWVGSAVTDAQDVARLDKLADINASFSGTGDLEGLLDAVKGAGYRLTDLQAVAGYTNEDWIRAAQSVGVSAFASGGSHLGGARIVGEFGPELEVTGPSRIFNARQTSEMLQGGGSQGEVVAAIETLRAQQYEIGFQMVSLTQTLERLARKDDAIGTPPVRAAEAAL